MPKTLSERHDEREAICQRSDPKGHEEGVHMTQRKLIPTICPYYGVGAGCTSPMRCQITEGGTSPVPKSLSCIADTGLV